MIRFVVRQRKGSTSAVGSFVQLSVNSARNAYANLPPFVRTDAVGSVVGRVVRIDRDATSET